MEKKNMDKIDILYDYANNKKDELKKRLGEIRQSLYAKDMKTIISALLDHNIDHIDIEDTRVFIGSNESYGKFFDIGLAGGLNIPEMVTKTYDKDMINHLNYVIEQYNCTDSELSFIEDFMDVIVSEISDIYKEITEKESDDLDKLLDLINYDVAPTKHLKITVEWI